MKEFTKSDLRTGMRVKLNNNKQFIVLINNFKTKSYGTTDLLWGNNNFLILSRYENDLTRIGKDSQWDICKVYDSPSNSYTSDMLNPNTCGDLLWERTDKLIFKDFIESKGINWDKFIENCRVENQRWEHIHSYITLPKLKKLPVINWLDYAFNWKYNILDKTCSEIDSIDSDWKTLCDNMNNDIDNILFE